MAVSGLMHYSLQVPDLDEALGFYRDFGLETVERGDGAAVRCSGRDQDQVLFAEGPDKRLHYVAFAIETGTLGELRRHLERQPDVVLIDPPADKDGDGLWLRDPDGTLVHVVDTQPCPPRQVDPVVTNVAGDYRRFDRARWVDATKPASPRRLGHVLIFSSDNHRSEEFYARTLGFRLSDRIPGVVSFLNCGSGDHHIFGFVQSSHSGLHHSSWEVGSVDEIVIGARSMQEAGHGLGWGLGRHSLGSNLFHYLQDPWGSWIEYFSDMDQISDSWVAQDWDTAPAVWSPPLPGEFLHNNEPKPD